MKIKKSDLERIIKEEIDRALEEASFFRRAVDTLKSDFKSGLDTVKSGLKGGAQNLKGASTAVKGAVNPSLNTHEEEIAKIINDLQKVSFTDINYNFVVPKKGTYSNIAAVDGKIEIKDTAGAYKTFSFTNKVFRLSDAKRFIEDRNSREEMLKNALISLFNAGLSGHIKSAVLIKIGKAGMAKLNTKIAERATALSKGVSFQDAIKQKILAASTPAPTP